MKLRIVVLPALALGGFALTGLAVARFNTPPKTGPAPVAPPSIPFPDRVAGVGAVEPASETIAIGAHVGGVVTAVLVEEGARVEAGAPLVELDAREADARIAVAKASRAAALATVETARARVDAARLRVAELRARPRAEDIAEAAALVAARRAALNDASGRLERLMKVSDRGTAANEQPTLEFAVAFATAQVAEAEAKLVRTKVGTYPEDLAVAEADVAAAAREMDALGAQVAAADAQLRQAEVARELLTVRAPIAGTVLRLDARPGEYKAAGPNASSLLRLGDISTLHVRTDIDELDAWRFDPSGRAVATVRGGSREQVRLRFIRVVPDVAPKKTLTGENAERIDTRVLQVIYALENPPAFLQPGMLVDVAVAAKATKSPESSYATPQENPK
ncbi:MAG: efflux RND transporter periplasmic adaptor subunit [Limnohabitans sp.]|jgi:HlyD family secretion protein|nr:efflux RND transporter periplasmic adaptor subunit [Limnohabitans sp.]